MNRVDANIEIAAGEDDQERHAGQAESPVHGDVDAAGHVDAEGDFEDGYGQAGEGEDALSPPDFVLASGHAVFLGADKFAGLAADGAPDGFEDRFGIV